MPKRVDAAERRALIADALFRVIARDGLGAVSLRHVATEAGVTAGMVQHYFSSKHQMMTFAMQAASARYEARIGAAVGELGAHPPPGATLRAVLANFIPRSEAELHDGRISLEFQAYAAGRDDLTGALAEGDMQLREWLAGLIAQAADVDEPGAAIRAAGLLASAEGLGLKVLSSGMPASEALSALDAQLHLNGIR
ncbi:TetR family transcriptional regulator [Microbacterium sp.]|uniref:TetR/AcrR family transcriptional regulator n=1 Tax=Microbacterium sp. TaxID=51671 RepID=UPI0028127CEF|nr:TetR family transcriptional regulator [Microbacterium sp.]